MGVTNFEDLKRHIMTIIEIEDYYGNTLMSFRVQGHIKTEDFDKFNDCEVADTDGDYINGTPDLLVRIQSTLKQLKYGDFGEDEKDDIQNNKTV